MTGKIVLFMADLVVPGGAERVCVEEASYLQKKGIDVTILTFNLNERALYDHKELKIEIVKGILGLRKKLKSIKPDLIIAQSYWDCSYVYLATLLTNLRYATHIHATMFWMQDPRIYSFIHSGVFDEIRNSVAGHQEFIPENPKFSIIKKIKLNLMAILDYYAVRKAKKIFTMTGHMAWEIKKLYGKNAITNPGAISSELLDYKPNQDIKKKLGLEGKRILLNINRLDKRKRVDKLIEAFSRIEEKDTVLVIGGTGEEKDNLVKLAKDLGVDDRVIFVGFIPESELWDYHMACEVFVHPNWTDFVLSPYEALALQRKVVWSTEMDSHEYIKTNEHVFATEPTVEGIKEAIEKALNTKMVRNIDMSYYVWDKYFKKIYNRIKK